MILKLLGIMMTRKLTKAIFLLTMFIFISCSRYDESIQDHPLVGNVVQTSDFILAVEGLSKSYADSKKIDKINAHLMGIDGALSLSDSFSNSNIMAKEILPAGTSLKVVEVYKIKAGWLSSFLTSDVDMAIMSDENKNMYTAQLFNNQVIFDLNKCESSRNCSNRKYLLNTIFKEKNKKHLIYIDYRLSDEKTSLEKSNSEFVNFLKNKNIKVDEVINYRPSIVVEVDYLDVGTLILYSSFLNIENMSRLIRE